MCFRRPVENEVRVKKRTNRHAVNTWNFWVRLKIIGNEIIKNVGKSESCMVRTCGVVRAVAVIQEVRDINLDRSVLV